MILPLACSLVGRTQRVTIVPGTLAAILYGTGGSSEPYYCNYGVNPGYRSLLEAYGMVVSGVGSNGEVRVIELPAHPFFLATLFVAQARSTPERPHPVVTGFAAAASRRAAGEARRTAGWARA